MSIIDQTRLNNKLLDTKVAKQAIEAEADIETKDKAALDYCTNQETEDPILTKNEHSQSKLKFYDCYM